MKTKLIRKMKEATNPEVWVFVSNKKIKRKQLEKPSDREIVNAKNGRWMKMSDAKKEGIR